MTTSTTQTRMTAEARRELRTAVDQARRDRIAAESRTGRFRWLMLETHGLNGYKRHGCRCDVCHAAKMAAQAQYRARRGR